MSAAHARGQRVLVVRPDRIGDLMVTTPVFRAIKQAWPDAHVGALVRAGVAPLLEHNPDVDTIVIERDQPLGELVSAVREGRWDVAVHAFVTPRTVLATWRAGVPERIGPASKWPSLLLTRRIVQQRSHSARHEGDYNLELLAPLGIKTARVPTRLELTDVERAWGQAQLVALGLDPTRLIVAIHPGSGNSAGRWPLRAFAALADRIAASGSQVVLTFGPGEGELEPAMATAMAARAPVIPAGTVTLRQLAAVIASVQLFVSNSTGPLHMAVAMGVPTVSFYSLTPATTPVRWGPFADGHDVLTPEPGAELRTRLDLISVDAAYAACVRQLVAGPRSVR